MAFQTQKFLQIQSSYQRREEKDLIDIKDITLIDKMAKGREYTTMTIKRTVKQKLDDWADENCSRKDSYSDVLKKLIGSEES